jgi:hypothetical protein
MAPPTMGAMLEVLLCAVGVEFSMSAILSVIAICRPAIIGVVVGPVVSISVVTTPGASGLADNEGSGGVGTSGARGVDVLK